jgi:acyl-CoA synthetase (AMP-forming)/AMP-acid ligase II
MWIGLRTSLLQGGKNVYPREVEEQLYARQEVEECAVIRLPDKEWGERVTAFIVPKSGHFSEVPFAPLQGAQGVCRGELPKSPTPKKRMLEI